MFIVEPRTKSSSIVRLELKPESNQTISPLELLIVKVAEEDPPI